MLAEYVGLLLIFGMGLALVATLLAVHITALPERAPAPGQLNLPHTRDVRLLAPHHRRNAVRFYVIAMLFVVFEGFAVFFYPWGAVFGELGWYGYGAMSIFAVPLLVGLFYESLKGACEW